MRRKFIFISIFIVFSATLIAHDVQISVAFSQPAVIVRSVYSGSEPISYASVLVFSPSDRSTEHQNGRSDANGVFVFVPDKAGKWKFIIDDEMGHKEEKSIEIGAEFLKGVAKTIGDSSLSTYWKAMIGISFIIGCTGIFFWMKARKVLRAGKKR